MTEEPIFTTPSTNWIEPVAVKSFEMVAVNFTLAPLLVGLAGEVVTATAAAVDACAIWMKNVPAARTVRNDTADHRKRCECVKETAMG